MGDELKCKLDIFVTNMTKKIEKKELFPEIQQEYDEVIEFFDKLTILTNEEFEDLEKAINKYESTVKKNEEQINSLLLRIKSDDEKIKSLQDDLSKNSNLEEQYKKLNEEYNKLKQKMDTENNEISNYQIKIKNNEKIIGDLQNEINKVKKEIFEKKIKITEFERDKKQNEILKNETNEKINKLINEKNDFNGTTPGYVLALRPTEIRFNVGKDGKRMDVNYQLPIEYSDGWVYVVLAVDREAKEVRFSYDFKNFQTAAIPENLADVDFDCFPVLNIGQDGTGKYRVNVGAELDEVLLINGALTDKDVAALKSVYVKE